MTGKILHLHTPISHETIKPSSPTPSHLHTYNLSPLDQCSPHAYTPLILFYPNNVTSILTATVKSQQLKKSLSQTLTQYYPFAGTLNTPTTPYIDCNDNGVLFVEAVNDRQMIDFVNVSEEDETVSQFFADGMVWRNQNENASHRTDLLAVQLNHFACGGTAVAVSLSHRIGDGCTLATFVSHWAAVATYGLTDHERVVGRNPSFINFPFTTNHPPPETSVLNPNCTSYVTRKFVFPNAKLSELKGKIVAMAEHGSTTTLCVNELTRVEVLGSLIYKTAVSAMSPKSSSFKPCFLVIPVDLRKKFVPNLSETTVGNLVGGMMITTRNESETKLNFVVSEIKKEKKALDRVQSMELASENLELFMSRLGNEDLETFAKRSVWCSSLCGFGFYDVDFGWGKPAGASIVLGPADRTVSMLFDTPNWDGIEARVVMERQYMETFQNDEELLSFCQNEVN